jgi:hypothetical protein
MIRKIVSLMLVSAGLAVVSANPEIKVDNSTFSGGTVMEGRDSLVKAAFKITNERPACGCTVVKYDSIIAPGKTGVIEPVVNLKGMRNGPMARTVTVTSNAANTPSLTLTIEAVITPAIEISESHLIFENAGKATLYLSSGKKDLKINGVAFKFYSGGNSQQWSSNVPLNMNYKFAPTDSTRADGLKVFKLELDAPGGGKEPVSGEVQITTNHPYKQEIVLRGSVN